MTSQTTSTPKQKGKAGAHSLFHLGRSIGIQLLLLGIMAGGLIAASRYFPVIDLITQARQKVGEMKEMGALIYPLLFAACNILMLPGGVIAIGAGLFFGLWWGLLLVLIGNALAASFAFWVGRRFGRERIRRLLIQYPKWLALDQAIERQGATIIFLSQVHPLFPTSLLNYLYGVTRIPFWTCLLWITLGQTPGLFLYVYLGTLTQHGIRLFHRSAPPHPVEYVIWFGGLLLAVTVTTWLGKTALRILQEVREEPSENQQTRDADL